MLPATIRRSQLIRKSCLIGRFVSQKPGNVSLSKAYGLSIPRANEPRQERQQPNQSRARGAAPPSGENARARSTGGNNSTRNSTNNRWQKPSGSPNSPTGHQQQPQHQNHNTSQRPAQTVKSPYNFGGGNTTSPFALNSKKKVEEESKQPAPRRILEEMKKGGRIWDKKEDTKGGKSASFADSGNFFSKSERREPLTKATSTIDKIRAKIELQKRKELSKNVLSMLPNSEASESSTPSAQQEPLIKSNLIRNLLEKNTSIMHQKGDKRMGGLHHQSPQHQNQQQQQQRQKQRRGPFQDDRIAHMRDATTPQAKPEDIAEVTREFTEENTHKPTIVDPKTQAITIPYYDISLLEASVLLRVKVSQLTRQLRNLGLDVPSDSRNYKINPDTVEIVAEELGQAYEMAKRSNKDDDASRLLSRRAEAREVFPSRPPVVAVMGHVDHGKTTLMDALRRKAQGDTGGKTKKKKKKDKGKQKPTVGGDVAGTEAGGITQVITAFQVHIDEAATTGRDAVTFLDTPGHAAFSAMRRSGSDAADIIVLVIAADDGVSAQTIEILNFYKSIVKQTGTNGISLVVALNKIDKPGIDVDESLHRVAGQLMEHGIITESNMPDDPSALKGYDIYGDPVQVAPVSGKTGQGLDDLIERLLLQSEAMELRADKDSKAEGVVLDAKVDKGLGVVVDTIIRWGSVKKGDVLVSGSSFGKVRILKDASGKQVKEGLPSQPIRIIGFDSVPKAGEPLVAVESEAAAHELIEKRLALAKAKEDGGDSDKKPKDQLELHSSGRDMMNHNWKVRLEEKYGIAEEEKDVPLRIPIIIKADADGTLAAVRDSLVGLGESSKHNIVIDPILTKIGPLLATEVEMAQDMSAPVFCFNVAADATVSSLATEQKVQVFKSKIIYALLDEAKLIFAKYLPIEEVDVVHGRGKVLKVFEIGGKDEKVAGMMIAEGKFLKNKHYRVHRSGDLIVDSPLKLSSLKLFKEDVEEVIHGKECGISFRAFNDFQEDDEVECYTVEQRHPIL